MTGLLEGLSRIVRVCREPLAPERVDLSALAEDVAREVRRDGEDDGVNFTAAPNLEAEGDAALLRQLLRCLLQNAWRFAARRPGGRVMFGPAEQAECAEGEFRTFAVQDNGEGYEEARARRLFGPFQRFHVEEGTSRLGLGLALARRIVHRHGGRIWARAGAGEGATFWFTLPKGGERG
jgi:light-regulated signal transduction histidine kinase (bacteriophytochrome)